MRAAETVIRIAINIWYLRLIYVGIIIFNYLLMCLMFSVHLILRCKLVTYIGYLSTFIFCDGMNWSWLPTHENPYLYQYNIYLYGYTYRNLIWPRSHIGEKIVSVFVVTGKYAYSYRIGYNNIMQSVLVLNFMILIVKKKEKVGRYL